MQDYTLFVGVALGFIWYQRQHRWSLFLGGLTGKYAIPPTPKKASS